MPAKRRKKRYHFAGGHVFREGGMTADMANNLVSCSENPVNIGVLAGNKFFKIFLSHSRRPKWYQNRTGRRETWENRIIWRNKRYQFENFYQKDRGQIRQG